MDNRREIEGALNRRLGLKGGAAEALDAQMRAQVDWRGKCRVCGEELDGTMKELKAHRHVDTSQ
jgi:hypothetical protein